MRPTRSLALFTAALLTLGTACSDSSDADRVEGGSTTTRAPAGTTAPGTTPGTIPGEVAPESPDSAAPGGPGAGGGPGGGPGGVPTPAPGPGGRPSGGASPGGGATASFTVPAQPLAPPPGPGPLPADTSAIQAILRDRYGVPFTPEQGACLGAGFTTQPEGVRAFEEGYAPPLPLSQFAVSVTVGCYGGVPSAVNALLQSSVSQGGLNPAQATCWATVLQVLPADELARLLALEQTAVQAHKPQLDGCNRDNA